MYHWWLDREMFFRMDLSKYHPVVLGARIVRIETLKVSIMVRGNCSRSSSVKF